VKRPELNDVQRTLVAISMFHGLYSRVGKKVGVHPSYVSRVANGERESREVVAAIRAELRIIRDYLNRTEGKSNGN
jgi:transcriptional regulator with XRE-family HTH domain